MRELIDSNNLQNETVMNNMVIKTTILSIIFMGFLISITGIAIYFKKDLLSQYMCYLMPIPPIGVAAYVFVYNLFGKYGGKLSGNLMNSVNEIILGSAISSLVFLTIALSLVLLVKLSSSIN